MITKNNIMGSFLFFAWRSLKIVILPQYNIITNTIVDWYLLVSNCKKCAYYAHPFHHILDAYQSDRLRRIEFKDFYLFFGRQYRCDRCRLLVNSVFLILRWGSVFKQNFTIIERNLSWKNICFNSRKYILPIDLAEDGTVIFKQMDKKSDLQP